MCKCQHSRVRDRIEMNVSLIIKSNDKNNAMSFNRNRLSSTGLKLFLFVSFFSATFFAFFLLPSHRTTLRTRTLNTEYENERKAEENPTKREKIFIPFFLSTYNPWTSVLSDVNAKKTEKIQNTTRDMKVKLLRKQRERVRKNDIKLHISFIQ